MIGCARLERGFSLIEIAIVLTILGILLQAAMVPLSTFESTRRERLLQADLARIRDALIAQLLSKGALPCPTADASAVRVASDQHARCQRRRGGLPAIALALAGATDAAGSLLDPWGRAYRYAVSDADSTERGLPGLPDWTTPGEPAAVGIAALAGTLTICAEPADGCPMHSVRANDLVFVVLSYGADAGRDGWQEANHRDAGSFTLAPRSALAERAFDDALTWASRSELVLWLLRAGRLP